MKRYLFFLFATLLLFTAVFSNSSCGKIDGVSFSDLTLTYNGDEQKIEVSGVPEGATVGSKLRSAFFEYTLI